MQILILTCSGHTGGNTHQLAEAFAQGFDPQMHTVETLHTSQLNLSPCLGCNGCQTQGHCVQQDDMHQIYTAFQACDMLVFATPLYFWGCSAQMKMIIDRLYALGKDEGKGYFSYPKKKAVLLATSADTERHFWVFESLQQYFQRLVSYLGWELSGTLFVGRCGGTKVPRCIEKTDGCQRARQLGETLSAQS